MDIATAATSDFASYWRWLDEFSVSFTLKDGEPRFFFALDFWNFGGYTSSNLKSVSRRSTLWKRPGIVMTKKHRVQTRKIMMLQASRLFHPIDGPGVTTPIRIPSSSR